jgi:hypothetical protein
VVINGRKVCIGGVMESKPNSAAAPTVTHPMAGPGTYNDELHIVGY